MNAPEAPSSSCFQANPDRRGGAFQASRPKFSNNLVTSTSWRRNVGSRRVVLVAEKFFTTKHRRVLQRGRRDGDVFPEESFGKWIRYVPARALEKISHKLEPLVEKQTTPSGHCELSWLLLSCYTRDISFGVAGGFPGGPAEPSAVPFPPCVKLDKVNPSVVARQPGERTPLGTNLVFYCL